MYNPFSLESKRVLVTGASSGIGRAIAIACAKMGAEVILTGRNQARLEETLQQLPKANHLIYSLDLTDMVDLESFVEELPKLDGFVSSAGIIQQTLLRFLEADEIEQQLQINLLAPIHLTRLMVQHKKLNKTSSLVYISSINGNESAYLASSVYGATKSGLTGFAKEVALELAAREIRANCIHPGMIEGDLMKDGVVDELTIEADKQKYPLKRYGKAEEIAYAAIYLLSDASRWVTGTSLLIDGGYTMQ